MWCDAHGFGCACVCCKVVGGHLNGVPIGKGLEVGDEQLRFKRIGVIDIDLCAHFR